MFVTCLGSVAVTYKRAYMYGFKTDVCDHTVDTPLQAFLQYVIVLGNGGGWLGEN